MTPNSLTEQAVALLKTADAEQKCRGAADLAAAWTADSTMEIGVARPPDRPARPLRPSLLPPKDMPRRSYSGVKGRIALVHALAHIELNAVDLALDILCRFTDWKLPRDFYSDWVVVAADEARHHLALAALLEQLGARYGDLPAHDGLWQSAEKTALDLLERLAVIPMTLEARALDTTQPTMTKLAQGGDHQTPKILQMIFDEEIDHVAKGVFWFDRLCQEQSLDPASHFAAIIKSHFPKGLKPPFNDQARAQANFPATWYQAIARVPTI